MKIKHFIYYLLISILVFTSCDEVDSGPPECGTSQIDITFPNVWIPKVGGNHNLDYYSLIEAVDAGCKVGISVKPEQKCSDYSGYSNNIDKSNRSEISNGNTILNVTVPNLNDYNITVTITDAICFYSFDMGRKVSPRWTKTIKKSKKNKLIRFTFWCC